MVLGVVVGACGNDPVLILLAISSTVMGRIHIQRRVPRRAANNSSLGLGILFGYHVSKSRPLWLDSLERISLTLLGLSLDEEHVLQATPANDEGSDKSQNKVCDSNPLLNIVSPAPVGIFPPGIDR